jgi:hypothetical protein
VLPLTVSCVRAPTFASSRYAPEPGVAGSSSSRARAATTLRSGRRATARQSHTTPPTTHPPLPYVAWPPGVAPRGQPTCRVLL